MFCAAASTESSLYCSVETLMGHIAKQHAGRLSREARNRTRCIEGRTAERDEVWDINIPARIQVRWMRWDCIHGNNSDVTCFSVGVEWTYWDSHTNLIYTVDQFLLLPWPNLLSECWMDDVGVEAQRDLALKHDAILLYLDHSYLP